MGQHTVVVSDIETRLLKVNKSNMDMCPRMPTGDFAFCFLMNCSGFPPVINKFIKISSLFFSKLLDISDMKQFDF